jgi:hypothetical protein
MHTAGSYNNEARFSVVVHLGWVSSKLCETAAKEVDMGKTSGFQSMALSRRTIVTRSVAGAAGAAVLLSLVTEASAKMAQKAVEYQDTPKGDQECSNCSLFQEPNACTLVDGEISPKGWCKFWVKKTG